MQRTRLGILTLPVHRPRRLACPLEVAHHDGIQLRIEPLDPRNEVVEQLQAADRAATDLRGEFCGGEKSWFHYDPGCIVPGGIVPDGVVPSGIIQ